MKSLKIILLIAITASITLSCSTDDDDIAITADYLLGTWQLSASSQNGVSTRLSECDMKDLIIFGETQVMYLYNKNGSGSKCKVVTIKKDYTLKENVITEDDGIEITIVDKVVSFGPSSIILKFEEENEDEIFTYRETYIKKDF